MKRNIVSRTDAIASILLLIATATTILLEIYFSGPESTKLETSLFSVLQFVFSLAFSWILARVSLRDEFQRSQKRFAISAYRRIIEIRSAVDRLIDRTTSQMGKTELAASHELDVIAEIGMGIRESIKSSVSDWADVIGEEIETVEKIQTIREQQALERQLDEVPADEKSRPPEKSEETDATIEKLLSGLPKSLRLVTEGTGRDYASRLRKGRVKLQREKRRKGYIEVQGFYELPLEADC